jgi:hypothetical protein
MSRAGAISPQEVQKPISTPTQTSSAQHQSPPSIPAESFSTQPAFRSNTTTVVSPHGSASIPPPASGGTVPANVSSQPRPGIDPRQLRSEYQARAQERFNNAMKPTANQIHNIFEYLRRELAKLNAISAESLQTEFYRSEAKLKPLYDQNQQLVAQNQALKHQFGHQLSELRKQFNSHLAVEAQKVQELQLKEQKLQDEVVRLKGVANVATQKAQELFNSHRRLSAHHLMCKKALETASRGATDTAEASNLATNDGEEPTSPAALLKTFEKAVHDTFGQRMDSCMSLLLDFPAIAHLLVDVLTVYAELNAQKSQCRAQAIQIQVLTQELDRAKAALANVSRSYLAAIMIKYPIQTSGTSSPTNNAF